MALKVIGAGLGRTGTRSLKAALEELGFVRCYHMVDVFSHPKHVPVWDAAAQGKVVDWEELFQGYQATVDWPGCNFYTEYMRLYPEAKVILTVRDPESWHKSALETIYYVRNAFPGWMALVLPGIGRFRTMIDRLVWVGMFQGRFEEKAFAIEVFNKHNEEVRRVVPADRLLVYEVKEGWGPLCTFLGVDVPDKPFPRMNDSAEFRGRIERGARIVRAAPFVFVAVVALMIGWFVIRPLL